MATGSTPHYALPYPDSNEPVAGGAAAIQALATAIEGKLGWIGGVALGADAASIGLSGIPQTFTDLIVVCMNRLMTTGGGPVVGLRINSDSGATYQTVNAATITTATAHPDPAKAGSTGDTRDPATYWFWHIWEILRYADASKVRAINLRGGGPGTVWTGFAGAPVSGAWLNTAAAVTALSVIANGGTGGALNLKAGTQLYLYGRV